MTRLALACVPLLLAACAYPYNVGVPVMHGATVALTPGESATLPGGILRYVRLANDSRCKPDVQCVWAGDAVIDLQWLPSGGPGRTVSLHSNPQAGPNAVVLDTSRVTFTHLSQATPEASLRIDRAD